METKQFEGHTPGPWHFGANASEISSDDQYVCTVGPHVAGKELEQLANIRLIARAPELLKERDMLKEKNSELADQVIKLMKERDAAVLERNISEAREARYSEALAKAKEPVS